MTTAAVHEHHGRPTTPASRSPRDDRTERPRSPAEHGSEHQISPLRLAPRVAHHRRPGRCPVNDLFVRQEILSRLEGVRPLGGGRYMARCPMPGHEDKKASLSIGPGSTQPVVMNCHACRDAAPAEDIAAAAGIDWSLISNPRPRADTDPWAWMPCVKRDGHRWVANYGYRNELNIPVLGVARCDHKCFAQFRPDPAHKMGRVWSLTLPDGSKAGDGIPYRLPTLLGLPKMYAIRIVEGEKDANRLWSLGIPATCNAGGAGKWTPRHAVWLTGRDISIIADRDPAGRNHAMQVVTTLMPIANSIEIVQAATGKDVSDHLDAGHAFTDLVKVAEPKPFAGSVWLRELAEAR